MPTCPKCGQENPEGFRFCGHCAAPLDQEENGGREYRKVVTVLFCDVTGSTALGEAVDPEALRALLARYFEQMKAIIERHGGTVEKFIGDAVMAVFGVPQVHEDDALRAVRAALEMRNVLPELGVEARIGLNSGEVVVGTGERLATGDAVNVAARLEQAAAPGGILLGEETLRLVRDAVETEPTEPLELKGKRKPLVAHRLVALHEEAPAFIRRFDAPLVGRETELRRLRDAYEQALHDRSCQLFTLLGVAGVGKSRLTTEFLDSLAGATVVRARCLPYGEGITYWPVVELLRQLPPATELGLERPAVQAIEGLLGEEQAVGSSEEIAWAVRRLLEAAAAASPLVVLFDDIHWGEPTFLDLLEHVADLSRDAPLLLLCLARPELFDQRAGWGGGKLNATTVLLEPLSSGETDELLERLLGEAALPDELLARIREAAEGNPLFVEEMVALVEESGDGEVTVPPTIQALLAARLDQLEPSERGVLERGSVEGRVFHRGAVQALAPEETGVANWLISLVRKELVRPDKPHLPGEDAFRFRHLLIRDAAYEALPKATRAELHKRFAAWLQEHGANLVELDEIVGYHYEQAHGYLAELGLLGEDGGLARRAGELLGSAGRRAMARGDVRASHNLLQRAVRLLPRPDPLRVRMLLDLGLLIDAGELETGRIALQEAREEARALGREDLEIRAELDLSYLRALIDPDFSPQEQEALAREAIAALEPRNDHEGLARAWFLSAAAYWSRARWDQMQEPLSHSIDHARRAGNRSMELYALTFLLAAKAFGSTPADEGIRFARQTLEDDTDSRELQAWAYRVEGTLLVLQGRLGDARTLLERARAIFAELGSTIALAVLSFSTGMLELRAGNAVAAEREYRTALESLQRIGERGRVTNLAAELAEVLLDQGRDDEAHTYVSMSREGAQPNDASGQAFWRMASARLLVRRGEVEEAVRLANEAAAIMAETDELLFWPELLLRQGEVLELAGRQADATKAVRDAIELFERKGATEGVRRAQERLAALADR